MKTTKTPALHPDFEIRGDKVCCRCCSQWTYTKWISKSFHHDRACPSVAKTATDSPVKAAPVGAAPTVEQIHAAAKAGEISKVLADGEIVDAVAAGVVTMDDAMNRDY